MELHFNDTVKSGSGNTMMGPLTKWIIIPFGCHIFFTLLGLSQIRE